MNNATCLALFMVTADKITLSHTVKHGVLPVLFDVPGLERTWTVCGVANPTQHTTVKRHLAYIRNN